MKKNNFKSLMQAAVLICTPLVIASCDDVFGDADNPIPSYMSIKEADVNLELHADRPDAATYTRTAIAATGAEIVYSSSDEKVATVDAKTGKITAVGEGECQIIAEATGKDSHGNMTYQPQKSSFTVKVKDYRARVKFAEESAIVNSALIKHGEFKMKDSEVFPATGCTVGYTHKAVTGSEDPISTINDDGTITLIENKNNGKAVITATMTKAPDGYEMKSFGDGSKVEAEFTLEVKEGVVYVSGYDADGNAITKSMFKDYNGEKYTNLSDVVKGSDDVALAAGWYYLDKSINFSNNIRIKGDVNIIVGDGKGLYMPSSSIMDESANKAYKLNFFTESDPVILGSWAYTSKIQDFKEVNVLGASVYGNVDKVANVTINKGFISGSLTGTGNVNITDGSTGQVKGFATVTLAKGTASVGNLLEIGSVILSEGTSAGNLTDIETITIDKAASIGSINVSSLKTPIASATITKTNLGYVKGVTTLTLNEVTATGTLNNITTLNINKGTSVGAASTTTNFLNSIGTINMADGKVWSNNATVNALNISGGDMVVYKQITGFNDKGAAAGKITMAGGTLKVGESLTANNEKAVIADVQVTKGDFTAESNYHAVEGALIGTFYGSTDNKTWTKIENEDRPKYITTIEPKK